MPTCTAKSLNCEVDQAFGGEAGGHDDGRFAGVAPAGAQEQQALRVVIGTIVG